MLFDHAAAFETAVPLEAPVSLRAFVGWPLAEAETETETKTEESPGDPFVAALQRGDASAYRTLVRDHAPRLRAVIRRIVKSDAEVEDCLQDALLQVHRRIGSFQERSAFTTWLHRVAVNAALMHLRKKKRQPVALDGTILEAGIDAGAASGSAFTAEGDASRGAEGEAGLGGAMWSAAAARPDRIAGDRDTLTRVLAAIDRLPESLRAVMRMSCLEDRDSEEIAESLGISMANVRTRLHRARKRLVQEVGAPDPGIAHAQP